MPQKINFTLQCHHLSLLNEIKTNVFKIFICRYTVGISKCLMIELFITLVYTFKYSEHRVITKPTKVYRKLGIISDR